MPQRKKNHASKISKDLAHNKNENYVPKAKKQQSSQNEIEDFSISAEGESFGASGSSKSLFPINVNVPHNFKITKVVEGQSSSLLKDRYVDTIKQDIGKACLREKEILVNQSNYLHSDICFKNLIQNGHLASHTQNGCLQSDVSAPNHNQEKLASAEDNVVHLKSNESISNCILFKYFAESLLYLHFILSWTFVASVRRLDIPLNSERNSSVFSLEEGLVYKVIWCLVFGCVTDFLSWKASFWGHALMWALLRCSLWFPKSYGIIRVLFTVCASSSPLLVSLVGIAKIWGRDCVGALSRLGLVAYLFPLCLRFCISETPSPFRKVLEEEFIAGLGLNVLHYGRLLLIQYVKKVPIDVLIIGCAFCLVQIPALCKDASVERQSSPPAASHNSRGQRHTFQYFIKAILLKALIYVPSSLWLAFDSISRGNGEERARTMFSTVFLCLVVQSVVVPVFVCLLKSPRTALIFCSAGLCVVHVVSLLLFREWNDDEALLTTLAIYTILCVFHTFLESFLISGMRGRIGAVFATLSSLHFVIHFEAQSLRSSALSLEALGPFTPSRVALVAGINLKTLWKRLLITLVRPFEFVLRTETRFGEFIRPFVFYAQSFITSFCSPNGEMETVKPDEGKNCGSVESSNVNILSRLADVDIRKDTTFLSLFGIISSVTALLLILCQRRH